MISDLVVSIYLTYDNDMTMIVPFDNLVGSWNHVYHIAKRQFFGISPTLCYQLMTIHNLLSVIYTLSFSQLINVM